MSNGATIDYKQGPKNNQRHWAVNQIKARLKKMGKRPPNALVLYLAGKDDLEGAVYLQKGFKANNLIAVDRDRKVVKELRDKGRLAVCGDLPKVVENWSLTHTIDVLSADLCCGLNGSAGDCMGCAFTCFGLSPCFVLSINLLRGRDGAGSIFANNVAIDGSANEAARARKIMHEGFAKTLTMSKHRGKRFATELALVNAMEAHAHVPDVRFAYFISHFMNASDPEFNSYRSHRGKVRFDSAVLSGRDWGFFQKKLISPDLKMQRQISAVLATRTRQMK